MAPEQQLAAARLRIRRSHPFFATLALFARYQFRDDLATAATDGLTIALNPVFFSALPRAQQASLILHELLHAALHHVSRRGQRDPLLWNIAADIVVNTIIDECQQFELPAGALRDDRFARHAVEEIYEALKTCVVRYTVPAEYFNDIVSPGQFDPAACPIETLPRYWQDALRHADTGTRLATQRVGHCPAGLLRAWSAAGSAQIDWRTLLWQFVAHTPCDYQDFDRRHIHRGYYLDALHLNTLQVYLCVDTSGSISMATLDQFATEVMAIQRSYPHIAVSLFFADAALAGPYPLAHCGNMPAALGGGGTSFVPFFDHIAHTSGADAPALAIYLTDGDGRFPPQPPDLPTLWVVCPGGKPASHFPFGEVTRLFSPDMNA